MNKNHEHFEKLKNKLLRLRQYYPCRIIWGYLNKEGVVSTYASLNKVAMHKAVRDGKEVYKI